MLPSSKPLDANNNTDEALSMVSNRHRSLNSVNNSPARSQNMKQPMSQQNFYASNPSLPNSHQSQSMLVQQYESQAAARVEVEVQALNHCFDDIERFVSRLQASLENIRELEKKHQKRVGSSKTSTKSKKLKILFDSMMVSRI